MYKEKSLAWAALWLLFLFSGLYFQNNLGGFGLQLAFNNVVWFSAAIFIVLAIFSATTQRFWLIPSQWLSYFFLFFLLFLPLAWSGDNGLLALGRLIGVIIGLLFLFSLFQLFDIKQDEKALLFLFVASASLQCIIGICQFFQLPFILDGYNKGFYAVPLGIFQHHTLLPTYAVSAAMASLWLLFRHNEFSWRYGNVLWWCVIGSCLISCGFCVYIILARTGILAMACALFLMLFVKKYYKRNSIIGLSLLLAGLFLGFLATDWIQTQSHSVWRDGDQVLSSNGRSAIWFVAWQLFEHHWLTGVGLGNFEHAFAEQRALTFYQTGVLSLKNVSHPHNELLFWADEGGIFPVLGILFFCFYFFYRIKSIGCDMFAYLAMLLPMILHCLTEYPFYHSALHWFAFLLLLYLAEAKMSYHVMRKAVIFPFALRMLSVILLVSGGLFLITNLYSMAKLTQVVEIGNSKDKIKSPLLPLLDIANPVVFQHQIVTIVMNAKLQLALKDKDRKELQEFIDWGWQFSQIVVRPETFAGMIKAAQALGDKQQVDLIVKNAHWLYPEMAVFNPDNFTSIENNR
ncbi:PglL family O-oligosaccharyltransferase [Gallaecimonas mangrovi]|uniref:PglL family O-oligosaccharyltransferase n=1 Tax=Gallaecimonas mangrovi TaxID=2291597 RepID=UPI000E20A8A8|nr:O-antigen ligase family protein [Gallaecimonas mangrovi]